MPARRTAAMREARSPAVRGHGHEYSRKPGAQGNRLGHVREDDEPPEGDDPSSERSPSRSNSPDLDTRNESGRRGVGGRYDLPSDLRGGGVAQGIATKRKRVDQPRPSRPRFVVRLTARTST